MKILHTSDWHLGHLLHGASRQHEHARFLDWLPELLSQQDVDALIVAGDIYDSSNPPSYAQRLLYDFLARVLRERPDHFQVVLLGGNHDSAIRLDAPSPLLDAMRVHVVGGIPKNDGIVDLERMSVPLRNSQGQVAAWVAAMPFIRVPDLPPHKDPDNPFNMIEGVRILYSQLFDHIRRKREDQQAVIATGHCYMNHTTLSLDSERKILGGNQNALPDDVFPDWLAYVALGHLHKAQRVNGQEAIRYCGSPIPLSFAERDYSHQVNLIHLDGPHLQKVEPFEVPRQIEMISIRNLYPDNLSEAFKQLPDRMDTAPADHEPFLEVKLQVSKPEPGLRRRVEEELANKAVRLLKIVIERDEQKTALAEQVTATTLRDMKPGEVFERIYQRAYQDDPPPELSAMFHELLGEVERGET